MSKLLIDEHPLVVLPSLAATIGLSESIFVQQLHYWLEKNGHERDGRRWVYNTYTDWGEQFTWWNPGSIRRIIGRLRKNGIVLATDTYNRSPIDKTLWYTIDYETLNNLTTESDGFDESSPAKTTGPADQSGQSSAETPTVENDSPCVPKVQTNCTQGTDEAYRGYSPSVPKARSNNQRLPSETIPKTTTEREENPVGNQDRPMTDPASPLPHDGLRIALCSVLKNDYGLLPQRKQAAIDDAVKLLQERKITVEQVNGFLTFWEESQPLGPSICATTPHLNQVLEFMTACIAWQEEQRQCAEEVEIELREIHSRREAYERLHPDLSDFSAGDIPEEVQDWWDQLLNEMRLSLQPVVFERWLEQIRLVEASERLLTILVPDEQRRQWLEQRFNDQLSQRLQRISDQDFQFQYLLPQQFENRQ